jgi:Flp pilus assembly protein TadD
MKTATLETPAEISQINFQPDPILFPEAQSSHELAALKDWCLARADEWYKLGLTGPARDFLTHATDIDPQDVQAWIALGSLHYQLGVYTEAGLAFHRAAQLRPQNARIYLHLGLTHQKLGHDELAEALFNHALNLQPHDSLALSLLGDFFMGRKRFDRARPYYEQLMQQRPDDVDVLLRLGVCNYRTDEGTPARQCFERVLRIQPTNEVARENLDVMGL